MRIALTNKFERDLGAFEPARQRVVREMIEALLSAFRRPDIHSGLGLRKLHPSGIWEAHVGFGLRVVILLREDVAALVRVGTHDEIRCYLRSF